MDGTDPTATHSLREALRETPLFAGLPDPVLEQIVALVEKSTTHKLSQALRKVQLFESLSDEDVLRIQRVAVPVELDAGQVLFEEGKKGDAFYVVLQGRVELVKRAPDGTEQKLAVAREGEAFGEMALLNQTPRSATARALEAARLLEISRDAFDSLLGGASFPVRMLRGISKALWATSVRLASSQARQADPRELLRSLSRVMQKAILPSSVPQVPGFSVMAHTTPPEKASGESAWDWFERSDGRVVFALLRARGDGLPPAHTLVLARTLLRELGRDQLDLARLLGRVNDALAGAQVAGAPQHVECALVGLHDGDLAWAAAGPVSAAVVRGGGSVVDLPADAPALGYRRGTIYRSIAVPMMPGDAFLSLARAAQSALGRGKAVAAGMVEADARDVLKRVAAELPAADAVTGEVFDNTALLVKCVEQPAASVDDGRGATGLGLGQGLDGGAAISH